MARLKSQVGRVFVILLLGVSLSWLMGLACAPTPCPSCDGLCTDLTYDKSGGFAGVSETVTIQPDGAFHATGGLSGDRAGTLSAEQFQELKKPLVDWCNISEPGEAEPCPDAFQYQIEYQGRALSWHDCTPNVSDQLRQIAALVEEVVRSQDQPAWLQAIILRFESQPVANPPLSIWRYEYQGRTVYYIPGPCCDQYSNLYDADGNIICHPDGGITGGGDGRCIDFSSQRTGETLIWQDQR